MERQELTLRLGTSVLHPSRRVLVLVGLGLLVSVLPALIGAWAEPLFWLFWVLLLLACGLDTLLMPKVRTGTLSLPKVLSIGEEERANLRIELANLKELEAKLDISEPLLPLGSTQGYALAGVLSIDLPLRGQRRGRAEFSALWLRYRGPLGLFCCTANFPLQASLDILLNMPLVQKRALQFMSGRTAQGGPQVERFYGEGSEFDSLREFTQGLDSRMIDWRASARHTKLLLRQCIAERDRQVLIAVDTGRLMAEPLRGVPRLDHALHAALLLSYVGAKAGDRVGFFAFDEKPRAYIAPLSGSHGIGAIIQKASALTYHTAETNFTLNLTELCTRLTRRSLIVVLTEFVDTTTAELMIENLQRVVKRHLVLFVAMRDPQLQQESERFPGKALDLHRVVIAASLQKERELVLLRLRRLGVLCLDALPEELGPALVNRYLEAKRRELL
jgi:uncharacterized protein (DUF58 family)